MCRDFFGKIYGKFRKIIAAQHGFTMIEMLIVLSIIGILASVAVPRFTSSLVLANTAKVRMDLQTLDAAIIMYEAQTGLVPTDISALAEYVNDLPTPPKGKCRLKKSEEPHEISATAYTIKTVTVGSTTQRRAACDDYTAGDFGS